MIRFCISYLLCQCLGHFQPGADDVHVRLRRGNPALALPVQVTIQAPQAQDICRKTGVLRHLHNTSTTPAESDRAACPKMCGKQCRNMPTSGNHFLMVIRLCWLFTCACCRTPTSRARTCSVTRCSFQSGGNIIDLDAFLAGLEFGWRKFLGFRRSPQCRVTDHLSVRAGPRSAAQDASRRPYRSVLASDATPRCASMASADRQMIGDATPSRAAFPGASLPLPTVPMSAPASPMAED